MKSCKWNRQWLMKKKVFCVVDFEHKCSNKIRFYVKNKLVFREGEMESHFTYVKFITSARFRNVIKRDALNFAVVFICER
jgi:hypothetical protein